MATIEELQQALVNADKAGDVEAAQALAKEIEQVLGGQLSISTDEGQDADTEQALARAAQIESEAKQYNPAAETVRSFAGGLLFNLADEIEASFRSGKISGQQRQDLLDLIRAKHKKFEEEYPGLSIGSELAGGLVLPGGAVARGVKGATSIGKELALGASTGAASGYGQAEGEGGLEGALQGAITGGMATGVLGGAGRILAPRFSEDARLLSERGVELTPGQMMGGLPEQIERGAERIPVVGNVVSAARKRGMESFDRGAVNQVLSNINPNLKVPASMSPEAAVQFANNQISRQYNTNVTPYLKFDASAPEFAQGISDVINKNASLPKEQLDELIRRARLLQQDLINNPRGNDLKEVKSKLSYDAHRYSKSPNPADQEFGDALQDLKRNFMANLAKQNGPVARALVRADRAEEDYIRLADAFASRTSGEGFTPAQLSQAIRRKAPSKISFAEGRASRLQPIAQAGERVLGGMPEDRAISFMEAAPVIGGISALSHYAPETSSAIGAGGALAATLMPLLYSKTATQKVVPALLRARPRPVTKAGEMMRTISPLSSQLFVEPQEQ